MESSGNPPKAHKTKLKIKLWGARGSLPAPMPPQVLENHITKILSEFLEFAKGKSSKKEEIDRFLNSLPRYQFGGYGGNTPCFQVSSDSTQLIIDGGSGLRLLGYDLLGGPCGKGKGEVHLFFTHFHWDHLIGVPFFIPIFIPGNRIHVHAVGTNGKEVFQTLFKKPYFPVALENLGAKIEYHELEPRKPFQHGDITLTPYQLDHPDPCWGYRIEKEGHVYAHCVDTEGTRVSRADLGVDLPLYQGVDTMVFDAQYTLMESIEKVNWGHASALSGLDIAMREAIRRVVFIHHDPASTGEKIAAAERQAKIYYRNQLKHSRQSEPFLHPVDFSFGYDGLEIKV